MTGPWSDDSRTQLSSKLPEISSPPPNPSLKLKAALGPLKKMLSFSIVCGAMRKMGALVFQWENTVDAR